MDRDERHTASLVVGTLPSKARSLQALHSDTAFAMTVVSFSHTVTDVVRQQLAVTERA